MVKIQEEFKARLDTALLANDMKPVELAKRTGISESTISQYRSGYARPKDERLVMIANVLGVSPSWLMGLDVPMREADALLITDRDEKDLVVSYRMADDLDKALVRRTLGLDKKGNAGQGAVSSAS